MDGRFITFEGIDGAGKSTAVEAVAQSLAAGGVEVWATAEETDAFGPAIRRSIAAGDDPLVTAYLFLADRFRHAGEIRRRLGDGAWVLCDRFMDSTLAYQSVTLLGRVGDPMAFLRGLHGPLALVPDRTILLDLPVEAALERVGGRGAAAPYEKQAFLEKVRAAYLELARQEPDRFVVVDASREPDAVAKDAADAVRGLLEEA